MDVSESPAYVSVATYAQHLGVSTRTVTRHARRGKIPGAEQGGYAGSWRIPAELLDYRGNVRNVRPATHGVDRTENHSMQEHSHLLAEKVRRLTAELADAQQQLEAARQRDAFQAMTLEEQAQEVAKTKRRDYGDF